MVFDSIKCSSWNDFIKNNCDRTGPKVYMGFKADPSLTGNYYLQTNDAPLYSRNELGTTYTKI